MLRVVEGGCRFGEIDAVLRKVRFFFLGIPFKSQPLNTGTIWDNINIELQYNLVGAGHLLGSARGSRAGDGGLAIANFCIFRPLQRFIRR